MLALPLCRELEDQKQGKVKIMLYVVLLLLCSPLHDFQISIHSERKKENKIPDHWRKIVLVKGKKEQVAGYLYVDISLL